MSVLEVFHSFSTEDQLAILNKVNMMSVLEEYSKFTSFNQYFHDLPVTEEEIINTINCAENIKLAVYDTSGGYFMSLYNKKQYVYKFFVNITNNDITIRNRPYCNDEIIQKVVYDDSNEKKHMIRMRSSSCTHSFEMKDNIFLVPSSFDTIYSRRTPEYKSNSKNTKDNYIITTYYDFIHNGSINNKSTNNKSKKKCIAWLICCIEDLDIDLNDIMCNKECTYTKADICIKECDIDKYLYILLETVLNAINV